MSNTIVRSPSRGAFYEPKLEEGPTGTMPALLHGIVLSPHPGQFEFPFKKAPVPKVFSNVVPVPRGILNIFRTQVPGTDTYNFVEDMLLNESFADYFDRIWALHVMRSNREGFPAKCYHCDAPAKSYKKCLNVNFNGLIDSYVHRFKEVKETFEKGYVWHPKQFGKTKVKELMDAGLFPEDYLFVLLVPLCTEKDQPLEEQKIVLEFPAVPDSAKGTCGEWAHHHAMIGMGAPEIRYEMVEGFIKGLRSYVVGRFVYGSYGVINERYEIFEGCSCDFKPLPIWDYVVDGMSEDQSTTFCERYEACGRAGDNSIRCEICYSARYCSTECFMTDCEDHKARCHSIRTFGNGYAHGLRHSLRKHIMKYQLDHNRAVIAQAKAETIKALRLANLKPSDITYPDRYGNIAHMFIGCRNRFPLRPRTGLRNAEIPLDGKLWEKPEFPIFELKERVKPVAEKKKAASARSTTVRKSRAVPKKDAQSKPLGVYANGHKKIKVFHDEDDEMRYGNLR